MVGFGAVAASGAAMVIVEVGDVVYLRVSGRRGPHIIAKLVHVGGKPALILDADDFGDVAVVEVQLCYPVFAVGPGEGVEGGGGDELPVEVGAADAVGVGVDLHVHIEGVAGHEDGVAGGGLQP